MSELIVLKNEKSLFKILATQFGQIISLEIGILISVPFVNTELILFVQSLVIPIIIILLNSKFNKPIVNVTIDKSEKAFYFKIAKVGRLGKTIIIPFEKIRITQKWKWLLNYNVEVLEIKDNDFLRIGIKKNKSNLKFIELFLTEINKLYESDKLNENQIMIK